MVEFEEGLLSAEEWLSKARELIPRAITKAKEVKQFPSRWKAITTKLELIPIRLSDLSSHPFFSKNTLCIEQLQSVCNTLRDSIALAELCVSDRFEGKLRTQSDLDSLSGRLDLNLRDCGLLVKTGVLGDSSEKTVANTTIREASSSDCAGVRELMARLQIGNIEAKHRALDGLVEVMREDEKVVIDSIGRSNVAALVALLAAPSPPRVKEKAVAVICSLAESSGGCEAWLVSEGAIPALIRLAESGGAVGREKAVIALQRLTMSAETARAVVGHGGARPLVEVCRTGDSVSQAAAACAIKNASAAPEARRALAEEGAVGVMIDLLDRGILLGTKEHAAECLQNLTAANEDLRRAVVREGGARSLLAYLDGPLPQEPAAAAVRNLVPCLQLETLEALGFFPRMAHVLGSGSEGARRAAAAAVSRAVASAEAKRRAGEAGIVPLLVGLLGAKTNGAREAAAQALASLVAAGHNRKELKRDERAVPGLVHLLEPGPGNTAKKYAVFCLGAISASRRCRRLMASYGAIGYLKKLAEMDVPGAKKLLERLERGRLKSLFVRK